MLNSYNPVNALSPEFLAVFTMVLQSILLHEYGHFAAARAMGLKAEIIAAKEPNVFATTRISAERPVTVRVPEDKENGACFKPAASSLKPAPPTLGSGSRVLRPSILELLVLSWNLKEISIPAGEKSSGAGSREIMNASLFPKMAEKYVKTVKSRLDVKLDYSLGSLRSLDTITRILRHGVRPREA